MKMTSSYTVEHRNGCRLIFGAVPVREMVAIMSSCSKDEVVDLYLASLTGATMVMGAEDALSALRECKDLPISPDRTRDFRTAMEAGLPAGFCEWLKIGDRGSSSNYIAHLVTGIPETAQKAVPRDRADFRRCLEVIDSLAEFATTHEILSTMSHSSVAWENFSANWWTLTDMAGNSSCQFNDLIQNLLKRESAND